MIPFELLRITNTTVVCNLTDGVDYALESYAPIAAQRRQSGLAGIGLYENVEESIEIHILGDTSDRCMDNWIRLRNLLDTVNDWKRGYYVNTVVIQAKLSKSTRSYVEADILDVGDMPIDVNPEFDVAASNWIIRSATITIIRRGIWTDPTEDAATTSAETTVPGHFQTLVVGTPTYKIPSPVRIAIQIDNTYPYRNDLTVKTTFLFSASLSEIQPIYASPPNSSTGAPPTSNVNESANFSTNTNVRRWQAQNVTPFTNYETYTGSTGAVSVALAQVWRAFAVVRNNSATATFTINLRTEHAAMCIPLAAQIPPIQTTPQVADLGYLILGKGTALENLQLCVTATLTSAAHTLDIDYIILLAAKPTNGAITIDAGTNVDLGTVTTLDIDPRVGVAPNAAVLINGTSNDAIITWSGDAFISTTIGNLYMWMMGVDSTFWNVRDSAGAAKYKTKVTGYWREAFLLPRGA